MKPDEVIQRFGRHLSQYERDEIMDYDLIYYLNIQSKNKGIGKYVKKELTCQDENPKDHNPGQVFNHGFDNDQADYIYEQGDQIHYRYEI